MVSRIINQSEYRGYLVNSSSTRPLIEDAIARYIEQLEALKSHYSEIYVIRFDLAFPDNQEWTPEEETESISGFFKKVRERLLSKKNGSIKKWVYGWAREHETAKKGHFHCFIAFPYRKVRTPGVGTSEVREGKMGLFDELWKQINQGGRVHLVKAHRVKDEASLGRAIYHISYLAKVRGKTYGKDAGHRNWDASRLTKKKQEINND